MIVRSKVNNNFLIRGEWYKVIQSTEVFHDGLGAVLARMYELENHTHKIWTSNWFHHSNFYTQEELREEKINEILTF